MFIDLATTLIDILWLFILSWIIRGLFLSLVIVLIIFIIQYLRHKWAQSKGRELTPETPRAAKKGPKNQELNLLLTQKAVDIYKLCSVLNTTPQDLRQFIKRLVQEGKVAAEFKGDDLVLTSDVEEFASLVEHSFTPQKQVPASKIQKAIRARVRKVPKHGRKIIVVSVILVVLIFIWVGIFSPLIS